MSERALACCVHKHNELCVLAPTNTINCVREREGERERELSLAEDLTRKQVLGSSIHILPLIPALGLDSVHVFCVHACM